MVGESDLSDSSDIREMNPVPARLGLVRTYERAGSIAATASEWQTSRQVVRKRLRRNQADKESGLHDRS